MRRRRSRRSSRNANRTLPGKANRWRPR